MGESERKEGLFSMSWGVDFSYILERMWGWERILDTPCFEPETTGARDGVVSGEG